MFRSLPNDPTFASKVALALVRYFKLALLVFWALLVANAVSYSDRLAGDSWPLVVPIATVVLLPPWVVLRATGWRFFASWCVWSMGAVVALCVVFDSTFFAIQQIHEHPRPGVARDRDYDLIAAGFLSLFVMIGAALWPRWLKSAQAQHYSADNFGSVDHRLSGASIRDSASADAASNRIEARKVDDVQSPTCGQQAKRGRPRRFERWSRRERLLLLMADARIGHRCIRGIHRQGDGTLRTTTRALAELLNCSNSTAHASLRELAAAGDIGIKATGTATYVWLPPLREPASGACVLPFSALAA